MVEMVNNLCKYLLLVTIFLYVFNSNANEVKEKSLAVGIGTTYSGFGIKMNTKLDHKYSLSVTRFLCRHSK